MKSMMTVAAGLLLAAGPGPALADRLWVSLEHAGQVVCIDSGSGRTLHSVAVGERPRGLALSPDRRDLYVAVGGENKIKRIDLQQAAVNAEYAALSPETLAVSPDGRFIYSSNDTDNSLSKIDIGQQRVVQRAAIARQSEGLAVSPDGRWLTSTGEGEDRVQWFHGDALTLAAATQVAAGPRYSRFSDDGRQLWVTSAQGGMLTVFDTATRQVVQTLKFEVPGVAADLVRPVGIRIDRQGRYAFVALGRADRVAVIDIASWSVLSYLPVGHRVWNLEFSEDQSRLYAVNGLSDDISVIDAQNLRVTGRLPAGHTPWGIAVVAD